MTTEPEPLSAILRRYSFRPERGLPNVWTRGRRHGRRVIAHIVGSTVVISGGARRGARDVAVQLDNTTVEDLESALRHVIRS